MVIVPPSPRCGACFQVLHEDNVSRCNECDFLIHEGCVDHHIVEKLDAMKDSHTEPDIIECTFEKNIGQYTSTEKWMLRHPLRQDAS